MKTRNFRNLRLADQEASLNGGGQQTLILLCTFPFHHRKSFSKLTCWEALLHNNFYIVNIIRSILIGRLMLQKFKWNLTIFYMFSGVCVCNESNLTGEPMPVSKIKAPDNGTLYDSEGARGGRHTLFSGTEVLQAGARDTREVLAIVTATGDLFIPLRNQPHFPLQLRKPSQT